MEFQLEKLLAPLDGTPTGEEPTTLNLYDQLGSEISKLEAIERVAIDWVDIDAKSQQLLSQHTKDLKVANILAYAWFQLDRFTGLESGFQLLKQLVESDYASDLYPRRKRKQEKARAAPFIWLESKLEKSFTVNPIEDISELQGVEGAISAFFALTSALNNYLGDDSPPFSELKTTFKQFSAAIDEASKQAQQNKPATESPPPSQDPPPAEAVKTASPQTELPKVDAPTVTQFSDIGKTLRSASTAVKAIAQQLRGANPFDENAYYLNRTAKWMMIQELPATGILEKQPNDQSLKLMQQLESQGSFTDLLNLSEQQFDNGAIFCMSLHRYSHNALIGLGQKRCAKIVLDTTLNFITRFPKILETTFKNGEPFVDELTKAWLGNLSGRQTSAQTSETPLTQTENTPWDNARAEGSRLLAEGKIPEAIELYRSGLEDARNTKESIHWRYELASLLTKVGYDDIVIMTLNDIKQELDRIPVSQWQPDLKISIVKQLLECHKRMSMKTKYGQEKLVNTS